MNGQMTNKRSNAGKIKQANPVASSKSTAGSSVKNKSKKQKAGSKPGLLKMIFFWILALLLLAAIFLRIRHYFNAHW
jgi:hypothetical protein